MGVLWNVSLHNKLKLNYALFFKEGVGFTIIFFRKLGAKSNYYLLFKIKKWLLSDTDDVIQE